MNIYINKYIYIFVFFSNDLYYNIFKNIYYIILKYKIKFIY